MTAAGRQRRCGRGDDRGSGVVELPIIAALVVLPLIALVIFVGRVHAANTGVESAARQAARTISIARDPSAAVTSARSQAETTARAGSTRCQSMSFDHQVGGERVTVTVSCTVDLSQATLLPVPGTWTASATATDVLDRHREVSGGFGDPEGASP